MSDRQDIPDWLMTTKGRLARIGFGTLLILLGLGAVGGFLGILMLLIGAVPIASAAYGTLLIGPLFGRDIQGRRPEEQPKEEGEDEAAPEAGDDESEEYAARFDDDDDEDEGDEGEDERTAAAAETPSEPRNLTGAPPLARAERPPGQEPRTKPLGQDD
jgi:hypothetical protein